jgi:3-hydroxyacyl-[acyl-carrier-protein] dehydratase
MNSSTIESLDPLRDALKRCPPQTYEAACRFRRTRDFAEIPTIVRGVIARFVDREHRARLDQPGADLRLIDDLGIDSLTMMEIVMLAEEALPITISNEELRHLRTLGEVEQFIVSKLCGQRPPKGSGSGNWYLDDLERSSSDTACPPVNPSDRPAA